MNALPTIRPSQEPSRITRGADVRLVVDGTVATDEVANGLIDDWLTPVLVDLWLTREGVSRRISDMDNGER